LPQTFLVRTSQITRLQVFLLITMSILLVILVGIYLANLITRPLLRLVRATSQVAQGNLGVKVNVEGNDELSVLAHAFNAMIAGLQEGFIYRDLLGRTVSPEVREQLRQTFGSGNLRLEGQQAVATVLMSDIRGFTTLSEQADPARVMNWLNEYFDRIVPIIVKHGGVVNKFDGDAMLAFFGILPRMLSPKKSALAACQAALEMVAAIDELNLIREQRGDPPLITGIGINTGVVIAGGLGAKDRLHYTIIGDTVNTAQRLEALTRQLIKGTGALIGHATFTALEENQQKFTLEPMGLHSVKGKLERIMVYRLSEAREIPQVEVTL
jgi:adenylate cyclase